MKKTLKTLALSATLAAMFLSAGAFAGMNNHVAQKALVQNANITVITKSSALPLKGQMTTQSCNFNRCIEV